MNPPTKVKGAKSAFNITTKCPDCGGRCTAIRSDQVSDTYREVVYKCSNDACEQIFVASIVPIRTVVPPRASIPAAGTPREGESHA